MANEKTIMEASSLIQPNFVSGSSTSLNSGASDVDSNAGQPVKGSAAAVSDTLTIASTNIVVARQVLTQQIDIALNINTQTPLLSYPDDSSKQLSTDAFGQNLANKVVQKFQDDHSVKKDHDHHHDHDHHKNVAKTVSMQVSQGFQQATAVINQLGIYNVAVADDVAQSRAQVDQAIDQQAARLTSVTDTAAAVATSTKRELSTSLQITTKDGDVVTIDLTRSQELTAAAASSDNSSLAYVGASSSTQIDFTVQGDLSKKERESIGKVIEQVSELAKKVFNGKTGAAMERLSQFKINTRQLTGVALSMSSSITQQAVAVYAQVSRITVDSVSGSTQDVSTEKTVGQPPLAVAPQEPVADTATQVVEDAAEVVNGASSSGSFENPFKAISQLFEQIADLLSFDDHHISDSHKDFVKALFDEVVDKLEHDHDHHDDDDSVESLLES